MQKPRENPTLLEDERRLVTPAECPLGSDSMQTGRRTSDRTNVHDEGSDANDTPDGLSEAEEAVRKAAEDIPVGNSPEGPTESVPVFDRGSLPPKV